MLLSSYLYIIIIYYYKIIYITFWEFRPNLSISERYERCSTPQRLPSGPYAAHMPWSRTGVKATSQKYSGVWSRDPNEKNTGGGRPPKRLFLGLGSRPAASLRSPDAPAHAPTTPRTPASRASVKGRDSTVVMKPDGRQIDAASAALRLPEQPARLPRPPLPPTTPWCRSGSPALAQHGRPTTRDAVCRRLPSPSRRARASSQKAGTMHRHAKKQNHRWPQIDRAPPSSGLARRPRRIHTKSTALTTPAATDSASSGDTVLKWRQAGREIHGATAVQQDKFDLAHFARPLSARRGSLQAHIACSCAT